MTNREGENSSPFLHAEISQADVQSSGQPSSILHAEPSQADVFVFICDSKQCRSNLKRLIRELRLRRLNSFSIGINDQGTFLTSTRSNVVNVLHVCSASKRWLTNLLRQHVSTGRMNSSNTIVYAPGKFELKSVFREFPSITVTSSLDIQKLAENVVSLYSRTGCFTVEQIPSDEDVHSESISFRRSLSENAFGRYDLRSESELSMSINERYDPRPKSELPMSTLSNVQDNIHKIQERPKSECLRKFYSLPHSKIDRRSLHLNMISDTQIRGREPTEYPLTDDEESFFGVDAEDEHFGTFVKRASILPDKIVSMEEKISRYTKHPGNEKYQKDLIVHIIPELRKTRNFKTLSEWLAFDQGSIKNTILQELEMLLLQMTMTTARVTDLVHVVDNVMSYCFGTVVMVTDETVFAPLQVLAECLVIVYILNSTTSNPELYVQTGVILSRVYTELDTLTTPTNSTASKQIKTLLHLIEQFSQNRFNRGRLDALFSEPNVEFIQIQITEYELHEQFTVAFLLVNMMLQTPSTKTADLLLLLIKLMFDSLSKREKTRNQLYPVLFIVNKGLAFRINKGPGVHNVEEWHHSRDKMLACLKIYITSGRISSHWRAPMLDHLNPLLFSPDKGIVREIVRIFEKTGHKKDKYGFLDSAVLKHVQNCLMPLNLKLFPGHAKDTKKSKQSPRWQRISGKVWHGMDVTLYILFPTKSRFLSSSVNEYCSEAADQSESKRHTNALEIMRLLQFNEKHSNLVKLMAYQYRPIPVFFLTENHKNLHSFLIETGQFHKWLSWERLSLMSINVIDAVLFLHNKGFVHRNLTTFSFCINHQKTVLLQDFSLTKSLPNFDNPRASFTHDVSEEDIPVLYSAPESILEDRFDFKTDIWMVGLCVHGIFTHGAFPYTTDGYSSEKILEYIVFQDLKPSQWPCIPKIVFEAIMACMHTNSEEREDLEALRKKLDCFVKDREIGQPNRLSGLFEADKKYPPAVTEEPDRCLPELFSRLKQDYDPRRSYYNWRCSRIRSTSSVITETELTCKDEPKRYCDDYSTSLRVEEPVSKWFVEEVLPQLTHHVCTRVMKLNAMPSKLKRLTNTTGHEYLLHYKCKPGQNLIHLALSYNFGAPGTDSTDIYYLGLVYNVVKFVHRMHEQEWLLRDICGFSIYVEDASLRIFMPRIGRMKRLASRQDGDDYIIDDILEDRYRWLPVEVLQNGLYSKQSDIYMLAMTIWELYTALDLGNGTSDEVQLEGKPFSTIAKTELLKELYAGEVPGLPCSCPPRLYTLMLSCWNKNRLIRPSTQHLLTEIKSMIQIHPRKDLIVQMVDLETRQRQSSESTTTKSDISSLSDVTMETRQNETTHLSMLGLQTKQASYLPGKDSNIGQLDGSSRSSLRPAYTRSRPDKTLNTSQETQLLRQKPGRQNNRYQPSGIYENNFSDNEDGPLRQKSGRQNKTCQPSGYYENEADLFPSRPETPGSLDTMPEIQEDDNETRNHENQAIDSKLSTSKSDNPNAVREDSGVFSVNSARCSRSSSYDQQSIGGRNSQGYQTSGIIQEAGQDPKISTTREINSTSRYLQMERKQQDQTVNNSTLSPSPKNPLTIPKIPNSVLKSGLTKPTTNSSSEFTSRNSKSTLAIQSTTSMASTSKNAMTFSQTPMSSSTLKTKLAIPPIPVRKTYHTDMNTYTNVHELNSQVEENISSNKDNRIASYVQLKSDDSVPFSLSEGCEYEVPIAREETKLQFKSQNYQSERDSYDVNNLQPRLVRHGSCDILSIIGNQPEASSFGNRQSYV